MSTEDNGIDIAILKREAEQTTRFFGKLENAIEKITNLGNDITKMLALHEQRLGRLEQLDNDVHGLVEKRRLELQTDIKYLDSKLANTIKEISDDIGQTEKRIMDAIKGLKIEVEKDVKEKSDNHDILVSRVASLEKWRWLLVGGGTVIGVILTKVLPLLHLSI